jgi:hypothetical protein
MSKKKFIKVVSHSGEHFKVDVSDEACGLFQIPNASGKKIPAKHGMKVTHPNMGGEEGVVQGVAPAFITSGELVLWVKWKSQLDSVGYSVCNLYVRV